MNSYAASCCTCFPKVLCGSATSASWPTASVPPACRSAFSCSLPPNNRKPDKALPSIRTHAILGLAPSVVARWCSSSGLRLPKSNFALHPRSRLQHETTPANPKTPCASARSVSPWLAAEHTLSSRSTNCTLRRTVSTQSSFNRTRLSVALRGTASTHPHTRFFPLLNPHKARVRRNHGRLPSSRCIESAQSHRARGRILPTRASDTALRLFGTYSYFGPDGGFPSGLVPPPLYHSEASSCATASTWSFAQSEKNSRISFCSNICSSAACTMQVRSSESPLELSKPIFQVGQHSTRN